MLEEIAANGHTPSHSVQKCQKAFIFDAFMLFPWDGRDSASLTHVITFHDKLRRAFPV